MKLRINAKKEELRCENCGIALSTYNIYKRKINGVEHYFCCSHCADEYEASAIRCC